MYFNPSSTSLCLQHIKKMLGASGGLRIVPRAKKSDLLPSDLTRNSLLPSFFRYMYQLIIFPISDLIHLYLGLNFEMDSLN